MSNKIYAPGGAKKLAIALVIFALLLPIAAGAIGLVSNPVEIPEALRGQEINESLNILNSEDKEVEFELITAGDTADWVTFYIDDPASPITTVTVEANGRREVPMLIIVPDDTPNGIYLGAVRILYDPSKDVNLEDTTGATVRQQVSREIVITVTDQEIIKLTSSVTPTKYALDMGQELTINAVYYNDGNIQIRPDLQIAISQNGKNIFKVIYPYPEEEESVKPLESKTITIPYQTAGLEQGKYRVEITVLLAGEIQHEDDFSFTLGEVSEDDAVDTENSSSLPISTRGIVYLLAGLIAIIIITYIIKAKSKK